MALLEARGLVKQFSIGSWWSGRRRLSAVDGVDLALQRGECLAIVGESGSGKTTLGRCLLGLLEPTAGEVRFEGVRLSDLRSTELRRHRRRFQMVFQDADGALDPRYRVGRSLAEPLAVHEVVPAAERRERVHQLLDRVGLAAELADRYPHQLSGGQRQRVGIARALATEPEVLVADEPVSGLDVSVRGQVLALLAELQSELGLALLLIAHDLAMVERVADRVAVMYQGRVVETAPAADLFAAPQHPYTVGLIQSVPPLEPFSTGSPASGPSGADGETRPPAEPPATAAGPNAGCRYAPRCPRAQPRCDREEPALEHGAQGRAVACWFPFGIPATVTPQPAGGTGTREES